MRQQLRHHPAQWAVPVPGGGLPEQPGRTGTKDCHPPEQPAPVRSIGQQDPHRLAQRPGQMRDRCIDRDDQIQVRDQRRGFGIIGQPWRQVRQAQPMRRLAMLQIDEAQARALPRSGNHASSGIDRRRSAGCPGCRRNATPIFRPGGSRSRQTATRQDRPADSLSAAEWCPSGCRTGGAGSSGRSRRHRPERTSVGVTASTPGIERISGTSAGAQITTGAPPAARISGRYRAN